MLTVLTQGPPFLSGNWASARDASSAFGQAIERLACNTDRVAVDDCGLAKLDRGCAGGRGISVAQTETAGERRDDCAGFRCQSPAFGSG